MNTFMLVVLLPVALAATIPENSGLGFFRCVRSCENKADGDYQSCLGCDVYATCANGLLYDNRPCSVAGTVWNDRTKSCEYESRTCEDKVKKSAACERNVLVPKNKNAKLSCPEGRAIKVDSALYGRQSKGACPSPYLHINRADCGDEASSTAIVAEQCNGRQACSVSPVNRVFGDPCKGTHKYLKVSYTCVYDVNQ